MVFAYGLHRRLMFWFDPCLFVVQAKTNQNKIFQLKCLCYETLCISYLAVLSKINQSIVMIVIECLAQIIFKGNSN